MDGPYSFRLYLVNSQKEVEITLIKRHKEEIYSFKLDKESLVYEIGTLAENILAKCKNENWASIEIEDLTRSFAKFSALRKSNIN
ncbi:hypothetical protein CNR22_24335 [Sphingobacteriaceae bacterium]|nr:hypothetical protein CNR22_24335 [Sphingobacteriaceae bacterium]